MPRPPFLQAQEDFRAGHPYRNPYAPPERPTIDHPHDLYAQGWRVAKWRKEADDERGSHGCS